MHAVEHPYLKLLVLLELPPPPGSVQHVGDDVQGAVQNAHPSPALLSQHLHTINVPSIPG